MFLNGARVVLVAALVAVAVPPASANGAVTIGSDLTATDNTGEAPTSRLYSQAVLPGRQVTSPIDGVVVRWRLENSGAGMVRFRVLRPAGSAFASVAATPTLPTSGTGVEPFDVSLPIKAGDLIGVDQLTAFIVGIHTPTTGATLNTWDDLGVNDTATPGTASNYELLMNADIEPDVDCDGLGDETQDPLVSGGCAPPKAAGLLSGRVTTKGKSIALPFQCAAAGGNCSGNEVSLVSAKPVSLTAATAKAKPIAVGRASFTIPAGSAQSVTVPLTTRARKALRQIRKLATKARVTGGGATSTSSLTIKLK